MSSTLLWKSGGGVVVVMLSGWLRGFNYFNIYIQKEQIDFASVVVFLCPGLRPVLAEGGGEEHRKSNSCRQLVQF